jgi:hypothetical protein
VGGRLLLVLALGLLLVPAAALAQPGGTTVTVSAGPGFGIGFGPLSIVPLSTGTPIFAPGDSIWIRSYENSSVLLLSLTAPNGTVARGAFLQPGGLMSLHTFTAGDPVGEWTVQGTLASTGATYNATVALTDPPPPLIPRFDGANLTYNDLALTFSVPATSDYNMQACTMGLATNSSIEYGLPASLGGTLVAYMEGNSVYVKTPATSSPFSVWFELWALRGYQEGGSIVSVTTLAADTRVIDAGPTEEIQSATLNGQLNLRVGRYDLRTFVRDSSGFEAYDSRLLKTGPGTWVSLDGCTELTSVTSPSFTMNTNLDRANSTWPRTLVMMFDGGGVGNFTITRVPVMEARIDVRSEAQKGALAGVTMSAGGPGVQSWDSFSSSIYLIGSSFPLNVTVGINFEGVVSTDFVAQVMEPYSTATLLVPTGTLHVLTTAEGAPLSNATVTVVPEAGVSVPLPTFRTSDAGTLTLTLPPGVYNMTASSAGRTATARVSLSSGGSAEAEFDLGAKTFPYLLYLEAAVLVAAAALDALVWRAFLEKRGTYREAPS